MKGEKKKKKKKKNIYIMYLWHETRILELALSFVNLNLQIFCVIEKFMLIVCIWFMKIDYVKINHRSGEREKKKIYNIHSSVLYLPIYLAYTLIWLKLKTIILMLWPLLQVKLSRIYRSHVWKFTRNGEGPYLSCGSYGVYVDITGSTWLVRCYTWSLLKGCHVHPVTATYIP